MITKTFDLPFAQRECLDVVADIVSCTFIQLLANGTLSPIHFGIFLQQDLWFLSQYYRAVETILPYASDGTTRNFFEELAAATQNEAEELARHSERYPVPEGESLCSSIKKYGDHLVSTAETGDIGCTLMALLPCPIVFYKVAKLLNGLPFLSSSPYRWWVESYATAELESEARKFLMYAMKYTESRPSSESESTFLPSLRSERLFFLEMSDTISN